MLAHFKDIKYKSWIITKLKLAIQKHSGLFLLLILGMLPLVAWFKGNSLIAFGDICPYFNPQGHFYQRLFMWSSHLSQGMPSLTIAYSPLTLPWMLLSLLGIPDYIILKLQLIFLFAAPGISMYYFCSVVFKKAQKEPARIVASIFYMLNMFVVIRTQNPVAGWTYILIPLLLGIYIRGLDWPVHRSRYVIYFALLFTSSSLLMANPPTFVAFLLVFISYFIYRMLVSRDVERLWCLTFSLQIAAVSLLLSLWWIIPVYEVIGKIGTNGLVITKRVEESYWMWIHARNSFLNIFWLNTAISWKEVYYPFVPRYSNPILVIAAYIPLLLVFSAIFFKSVRRNRDIVYFLSLSVIVMFLCKGTHPPLSSVNVILYRYIPGFWIFREPAYKFFFLLVPCYAILLGFSVSEIYNKLSNTKIPAGFQKSRVVALLPKVVVVLIVCSLVSVAHPLVTGEVIVDKRPGRLSSSYVKIPEYWHEASNWISEQSNGLRVLISPQNPFYQVHYYWGYHAVDFVHQIIDRPILTLDPKGPYLEQALSNQLLRLTYQAIQRGSTRNLTSFLGLINVGYILQRNDMDWTHYGSKSVGSPNHIRKVLSEQPNIHLEKMFGKLDLYKIPDKNFLPHIYASTL